MSVVQPARGVTEAEQARRRAELAARGNVEERIEGYTAFLVGYRGAPRPTPQGGSFDDEGEVEDVRDHTHDDAGGDLAPWTFTEADLALLKPRSRGVRYGSPEASERARELNADINNRRKELRAAEAAQDREAFDAALAELAVLLDEAAGLPRADSRSGDKRPPPRVDKHAQMVADGAVLPGGHSKEPPSLPPRPTVSATGPLFYRVNAVLSGEAVSSIALTLAEALAGMGDARFEVAVRVKEVAGE